MTTPAFAPLFDRALDDVARARRAGLRTRDGSPADDELEALRAALESERDAALARGAVDAAAIGALVRGLVAWYPEDQVRLIAALGAIASYRG